mmetsp:Transcript_66936/g.144388  ORF Transcript_66936/g.144388 Transcript_66936/m.144388 type:complete len:149 (-) Transcript_66936:159-605(-)
MYVQQDMKLMELHKLLSFYLNDTETETKDKENTKTNNIENFKVMIFCETKKSVKALNWCIRDDMQMVSNCLTGDMKVNDRDRSLNEFKDSVNILVCTMLTARGLDMKVDLVINYEMPNNLDDYKHRIGRTGRIGNEGKAISFLTLKDE